jgi:hypothetical protein
VLGTSEVKLKCSIATVYYLITHWGKYEQQKRWSDGKVQRLESVVTPIVAGLMRTASSLRAVRTRNGSAKKLHASGRQESVNSFERT